MLLRRTPLLIAAVLLLAAPHAAAEEDFEADREAGYLGVSYSFGSGGFDGVPRDEGHGFALRTGVRMLRWAAVELEGNYLNSLGGVEHMWNVIANVKAIYPLGADDRIQPFLVAGAGIMSFSAPALSDNNFQGVYKLGGGLDYFLTRNWVLQADASWVSGMKGTTLDYVSAKAGVSYVFR